MTNSAHWPLVLREGPLQGLKVLELSRILAGPLATMQLADLGADVIKVELPGRGDETRHWGPPYSPEGAASYFLCANRNKRSVELDLTLQGDLSVALELARQADVVVDNFMPGKLSELGLDYDAIRIDNPTLISATVSGFGEGNTYSGRPGFDFLAQAMGGLDVGYRPRGRPPNPCRCCSE